MGRQLTISLTALLVLGLLGSAALAAARPDARSETREHAAAPVAVQRVAVPAGGIRDEAAMVLVGTALIGLGAAVRRAA
jgi:hypothetical protein